jgi:sugar phosphate isomerase/epimerase
MNRRHFLQTATLAAAAGALPRTVAAAAPKNLAEPDFVRLAIATITCDGFGDRDFAPAFELIPQLGVKHVEFNTWYARNLTPRGLESIRRRCDERGLAPVCVQASAFGDGKAPDVAHKLWCLEAARRLGCRRVKFTGGKRADRKALDAVIGCLKELAPAAEDLGMLVLVENHAGNVLENIADYDAIFAAIDSPNVGLCLDTAHFEGAGVKLAEVVERFHARTLHVDLKDNANFGKGHEVVPYGTGVTDFDACLQPLLAKGYRGYLLIEMAHAEPKQPLKENLLRGVEMFRRYERG